MRTISFKFECTTAGCDQIFLEIQVAPAVGRWARPGKHGAYNEGTCGTCGKSYLLEARSNVRGKYDLEQHEIDHRAARTLAGYAREKPGTKVTLATDLEQPKRR